MPTTAPPDPWSDVTAVILAGGVGSRLKSVVSDRPKGLAEVNGRPFLAFLLDQLRDVGAARVVFSTGYLAPQIEEAFGDELHGMRISYSHEATPLGTGGGLRLAADTVTSPSLLVLNGDSYCEVDLTAFLADALRHGRSPALVLSRQADTSRFGRVEHGPDGRIGSFREKGESPGAGWINAGIYALPRELVLAIPEGRPVSLEREVFPGWIGRGLRAFPSAGRFLDIGTPESYREAADFFRTSPASPTP
ncbi:MAG: nucleotidyltransferase family protein [Planctomycetia bacterium]